MGRNEMVKDYAGGCIRQNSRNYRKKTSNSKEFFSAARITWKTIGVMLLVTLAIGITSTFWYGLQIQLALDQIGRDTKVNKELTDKNRLLVAQHDLMLTPKYMEKNARKIGLQPAAENQLRYQ